MGEFNPRLSHRFSIDKSYMRPITKLTLSCASTTDHSKYSECVTGASEGTVTHTNDTRY